LGGADGFVSLINDSGRKYTGTTLPETKKSTSKALAYSNSSGLYDVDA
jgi:hypothetical protein